MKRKRQLREVLRVLTSIARYFNDEAILVVVDEGSIISLFFFLFFLLWEQMKREIGENRVHLLFQVPRIILLLHPVQIYPRFSFDDHLWFRSI